MRLSSLRGLARLSWRDRWLVAQALVLLPLIHTTLRALSLARLQSILDRTVPEAGETTRPSAMLERVRTTTRLVQRANEEGLYRVKCLPHSLALWWLLRRQGAEAVLRVGVRKEKSELEAHAWVEYQGVALNDDADVHERFAAFDRVIAR